MAEKQSGDEGKSPATVLKDEGNDFFAKGEPKKAVASYSKGLELEPENHLLLSNRAAAYLKLNDFEKAVTDAEACVKIAPDWPKGFTRLAQALYRKGDLDACDEALAKLKALEPANNNIKLLGDATKLKRVFDKLKGNWYGQVAQELGGYIQTFNFLSESEVEVGVFDRKLMARLKLDVTQEPGWLDLLIQQEPGAPPAPEVKHIFKIEGDELHLCSPYMTPPDQRPTAFDGPALVIMKRGEVPEENENVEEKQRIEKLSPEERVLEFAVKVTEVIPAVPFTPEMEAAGASAEAQEAMLATVKFQNSYFQIKMLYGDETEQTLQNYLMKTETCPNSELQKVVDDLTKAMVKAGMMPATEEFKDVANQVTADSKIAELGVSTDKITPAVPTPVASAVAASGSAESSETKETPREKSDTPSKKANDPTMTILAVGAAVVVSAILASFVIKKKN
mmetsp:Transcript_18890/g.34992  ORF Transcript_18890/g.34992 Transcript_18890/m.34992 type:complete len:451 (-) Transcript_18890:73-1425(-)